MPDNLAQLDQSGTNCQFARVYLGPTIGWVMLPIVPELLVTSAANIVLGPYTSRVLLKAGVKSIALPSVAAWVAAQFQANQSAFDRSIWIKDYAYLATGAQPIIVTPAGADTIDGFANFTIVTQGSIIRLYPLTDLTGWYVG